MDLIKIFSSHQINMADHNHNQVNDILVLLSNNHSPLSTITLITLSLISLLTLLLLFHRRNNHNRNLPPSPPGWPLIGNLHQLGGVFHRSLRSLSAVHGPVMLVHMGRAPTLVVSSAEALREMVKNNDVEISDRPTTTAVRAVSYGNRNLGFAPYGEYWRAARKMTVQELLSSKRVQDFEFVRVEETARLVERIRRACGGGESVNVTELVLDAVNSVVARCIVGQTFGGDGRRNLAVEMVLKVMKISTAVVFAGDFVPWLSWIDHLRGVSGQLQTIFTEVDTFLEKVIQDREAILAKYKENNRSNSEDCYMVDILLRLQKDESFEFKFTRENIKAFLLDLLTAGTDTTSIAIEWLMAELMRNPKAMKKAQEEIRRVVGKKPKIDSNDINQMNYLKWTIKEALRLHPPAPLLVPRQITKEISLGGYRVPANTRLLVNAWAIQRDKDSWDDPDEFIPERFENSAIELKSSQDFKFVTFGFGRRGCAGMNFAISELEYLAANILYWFDWKLPRGDGELDMSEADGFAVFKKIPLHLIPMLHNF